jgi:hypothetical protein
MKAALSLPGYKLKATIAAPVRRPWRTVTFQRRSGIATARGVIGAGTVARGFASVRPL